MQETFVVRILYRQNATWQGVVEWLGTEGTSKRQNFRSALELIRLIDSAGGPEDTPSWGEAE